MLSTFVTLAALHAGSLGTSALAPAEVAAAPAPVVSARSPAPVSQMVGADSRPTVPVIRIQGEAVEVPAQQATAAGEDPRPARSGEAGGQIADKPAPTDQQGEADARAKIISPPAAQATPSPTERRAIVKAASEALSRVETASGRFVQVDSSGHLTEGSFALKRPGRMRFDYDAPTPLMIAADGATVAIRDSELETVDRVPLGSTPLGLILDDQIDFETEAEIVDVRKANGIVAVSMRDRSGEADGILTLIFDAGSYQLVSWRAEDPNGGLTTVRLSDVRTGIALNPRLFIVEEFEDDDRDRRR